MTRHVVIIDKESKTVLDRCKPVSPKSGEFTEASLQKLIFNEPSILPAGEIDSDFEHLIPLGREIQVTSGQIDVLYITFEGKICIVETKLWRNSEATRQVVAQIIGYAKDLSLLEFKEFCQITTKKRGEEAVHAFFNRMAQEDPDLNKTKLEQNVQLSLSNGRFLLLIVGDQIYPSVALTIDTIQSAPHLEFTFGLAELRFYSLGEGNDKKYLVVPQKVGLSKPKIRNAIRILYEKKKPEVKVTPYETEKQLLDKDSFLQTLDDEGRLIFKEIYKLYETRGLPINYGSTGITLNVSIDGINILLLEYYGSKAAEGQRLSIYFSSIKKNIKNGEDLAETFRRKLRQLNVFRETPSAMRFKFDKKLTVMQINEIISIIVELAVQIEANGMI